MDSNFTWLSMSEVSSYMTLTPGNTDDRKPVKELLQGLFGKIFADRGYVSKKLALELLQACDIEFFAEPRRTMKNEEQTHAPHR